MKLERRRSLAGWIVVVLLAGLFSGCAARDRKLIQDLGSDDANVRMKAETEMKQRGSHVLPDVEEALADPGISDIAKGRALMVVGDIGQADPKIASECVDVLCAGMMQKSLQKYGVGGCKKIGETRIDAIVAKMLQTDDTNCLTGLAASLKILGDISAIDTLVGVLRKHLAAYESGSLKGAQEQEMVRAANALGYVTDEDLPPARSLEGGEARIDVVREWIRWWETHRDTFSF